MKVVVLGGGLAGLSSAHELSRNGVDVSVLEKDAEVGGLARSFTKNGFTYDLGPHRFFTKQDELITHLNSLLSEPMILKNRKSRIYLKRKFFDYPLRFGNALSTMPPAVTARIVYDYLKIKAINKISPRPDDSFEAWVTNRFGRTLYRIFFGEYNEKTWGIPCSQMSADWAAQRISLLSLWDTFVKTLFKSGDQPRTYIEKFYYPDRGGIGQVSRGYKASIERQGGKILLNSPVKEVRLADGSVREVTYEGPDGVKSMACDHLFSTIPLTDLVSAIRPLPPKELLEHASKLRFRTIMFVQFMVNGGSISGDHWIYLPEKHILGNRFTQYNNFSSNNAPQGKATVGVEITCDHGDKVWNMKDRELAERAASDLQEIGLIRRDDVLGVEVTKNKHAYPIYDLDYRKHLEPIKDYLNCIPNLKYFGRSALFRYNNMDHSIDMGLKAAQNLLGADVDYRRSATGNHWFG